MQLILIVLTYFFYKLIIKFHYIITILKLFKKTNKHYISCKIKLLYLLETVQQISDALKDDENVVNDLKKLIDTICHTAPENNRFEMAKKLYNCVQFINDASDPNHLKAFNIYSTRLAEYNELFNIEFIKHC